MNLVGSSHKDAATFRFSSQPAKPPLLLFLQTHNDAAYSSSGSLLNAYDASSISAENR